MKQQTFTIILLLVIAAFFSACSNETKEEIKEDAGVTVDAGRLKFSISEAPFGADTEIKTRNPLPTTPQKVDLGESVEAEVSIEREAASGATRAPKAMSDGNYTIVAYKNGVRVQQKITFTVSSGTMTITSPKSKFSWVSQGSTYTFVCFNDKVQDNNNGTFTVPLANAATALIGKQSVTITDNNDKEVKFAMKHVGARVRTKLIAAMTPTNVIATLGYQANQVPASIVYDFTLGTLSTSLTKSSDAKMQTQSYDITDTVHDAVLNDDLTTVTGNQYLSVLAGTKPEELIYQITGGTVYYANINTKGTRKLKATGVFEANGAYTLTIKLMPRHQYLFEDGKTGHLSESGRQGHTPIAIVFAPHRAIALWDANGGAKTKFDADDYHNWGQRNSKMFFTYQEGLSNTTSGQVWTWEKNYKGKAKAEDLFFPAYYYAGNFYKSSDLTSKATLTGANINKAGVWYLPSWYEWKEVFMKLGFGDGSQVTDASAYPFKSSIVNRAFKAANGTSFTDNDDNRYYWSSSEYNNYWAFCVKADTWMSFSYNGKDGNLPHVRPFVAF